MVRPMVKIEGIKTALPEYSYSSEELRVAAAVWLGRNSDTLKLYERLSSSAGITRRNFIIPVKEITRLNGLQGRAEIFGREGVNLGAQAIADLFTETGFDPGSLEALVFSSCSVPVIPSIDAGMIDQLSLPRNMQRIPVFQHGCAGGVVGLSIGRRLAESGASTLVSSVELCSLVYQGKDLSGTNLVGSALFADGAGAMLLNSVKHESDAKGHLVLDTASHLIPNSSQLMGYDILDDGFHLRLSRDLPQTVAKMLPDVLYGFLAKHKLKPDDISHWLFHPGGVKILNFLEQDLNLPRSKTHYAWDVLQSCGNMSSATIFFVMEKFINDKEYKDGDYSLVVGIGPGLTLEASLLRYVE